MNLKLITSSSVKELMDKGFSVEEIMKHCEDIFENEHGKAELMAIKNQLKGIEPIDGVLYVEVKSEEHIWFVDKLIEKMSMDGKCKNSYLIKVTTTPTKHFYKGIRAISIRLFSTCGGGMSEDRTTWYSVYEIETEKAKNVVFEDISF